MRAPGIGSLKRKIPQLCVLLEIQWPLGKASKEQLNTDMPLDYKAKMALAYAAEEAERGGQAWIDKDHLLRGLLRFPNEACTALEILQLDLATAHRSFKRHPAELSDQPTPSSIPVRMGPEPTQGTVSMGRTRGVSMFERYTEQARRAIFFARFEAIHRRAEAISTAHLLLGLSWDEDSRAAVVGSLKDKLTDICAALGISLRPSTEIPYDRNGDIPLDNKSKMALAYAAEEADLDGQFWLDTDHLLRGLLRFPNEAGTALESVKLDIATLRAASNRHRIEFPPAPAPALMSISTAFRQTPGMVARPFLTVAVLALAEIILLFLVRLLN